MLAFGLVCIIATVIRYVRFSSTNEMADAAGKVMYEKQACPIGPYCQYGSPLPAHPCEYP